MQNSNKTFRIREFEGFSEKPGVGYKQLPTKADFDALERFVVSSGGKTGGTELMTLSARRNVGKIITAKNYVGVIVLGSGTAIEILPKIAGRYSDAEVKTLFLNMLKTLKDTPFKTCEPAALKSEKMPLFEIFMKMFVDEVSALSRQGFQSAYLSTEENARFYKGKLLVSKNSRYNCADNSRFFVCYDTFSIDRPENKLIKTALTFLQKKTAVTSTAREINRLLSVLDGVGTCPDAEAEFSKISLDRTMARYENILKWCRIFLLGKSFTPFAGNDAAVALLFPMDKLFESFVAAKFARNLPHGFTMTAQDSRFSLFETPRKAFKLRPDIVVRKSAADSLPALFDTKWKLLSSADRYYGISQADMYQMYAYGKKYSNRCPGPQKNITVTLLYPKAEEGLGAVSYNSGDGVCVRVEFLDLFHIERQIEDLLLTC